MLDCGRTSEKRLRVRTTQHAYLSRPSIVHISDDSQAGVVDCIRKYWPVTKSVVA